MAHCDLARWTARLGLGAGIVTTRTLRRRLFALAGRVTRIGPPTDPPPANSLAWAIGWTAALTRLRAIPLLA